jgi:hypothetical protein
MLRLALGFLCSMPVVNGRGGVYVCRFSWYGVVSVSSPWVAAEYAPYGEIEAAEGTVLLYGLDGVL